MSENKSTGNGKVKCYSTSIGRGTPSWLRILKLSKTSHLRLTLSLVTN